MTSIMTLTVPKVSSPAESKEQDQQVKRHDVVSDDGNNAAEYSPVISGSNMDENENCSLLSKQPDDIASSFAFSPIVKRTEIISKHFSGFNHSPSQPLLSSPKRRGTHEVRSMQTQLSSSSRYRTPTAQESMLLSIYKREEDETKNDFYWLTRLQQQQSEDPVGLEQSLLTVKQKLNNTDTVEPELSRLLPFVTHSDSNVNKKISSGIASAEGNNIGNIDNNFSPTESMDSRHQVGYGTTKRTMWPGVTQKLEEV